MSLQKILDWRIWALASLTLGLAPFNPPHIWGKLQWVAGGAVDMGLRDWFDLFLHGSPWLLLMLSLIVLLVRKRKSAQST